MSAADTIAGATTSILWLSVANGRSSATSSDVRSDADRGPGGRKPRPATPSPCMCLRSASRREMPVAFRKNRGCPRWPRHAPRPGSAQADSSGLCGHTRHCATPAFRAGLSLREAKEERLRKEIRWSDEARLSGRGAFYAVMRGHTRSASVLPLAVDFAPAHRSAIRDTQRASAATSTSAPVSSIRRPAAT